ncbi:MAG: hypothetical protein FWG65_07055 [Turicibacter sp.]|nr:hypothetical protein [Turicibacter sp.]
MQSTETQNRATTFAQTWRTTTSEISESQPFWIDFFAIFGLTTKNRIHFEERVTNVNGKSKRGRIDGFWKGVLLKSKKAATKTCKKPINKPAAISTAC